MAVSSGITIVVLPFFDLLGLALLGGGGFVGPGVDPSLPEPEAGVLSGGHLPNGGMSTAWVDVWDRGGDEDGEGPLEGTGEVVVVVVLFFLISRRMMSKRDLIALFS